MKRWSICKINIDKKPRRGRPTIDFNKIWLQNLYHSKTYPHQQEKGYGRFASFIPPVNHTFYTNLLATPNAEEERPLSGSEDDE